MSNRLNLLRTSVQHLDKVAAQMEPSMFTTSAYPSEWTVADTFSHLGSGSVIFQRLVEDSIAQRESDPAFNARVWDEWNAKDPESQVRDSLAVGAAFMDYLEATSEEEREGFHFSLGPFNFDFEGFLGLRLSEHAVHTWDIEVVVDPDASLSNATANAILDSIQFVATRAGKTTGEEKQFSVRTLEPARDFSIVLNPESVEFEEAPLQGLVDLELPADALVRLVYGRLDDEHLPTSVVGDVNYLRQVFPGL